MLSQMLKTEESLHGSVPTKCFHYVKSVFSGKKKNFCLQLACSERCQAKYSERLGLLNTQKHKETRVSENNSLQLGN